MVHKQRFQLNLSLLRLFLIGVLLILFAGCKSGKAVAEKGIDKSLPAKTIITNHYESASNFNTLSGKLKIAYSEGSSTQSVGVSFRMQRDQKIWISAPLGVIKAYITPDRVSFYNKLQNEYFDGDYSYISELLGIDVDFNTLQNLLLGQALFDLREMKYSAQANGDHYELTPKKNTDRLKTLFYIFPENFKIARQQLSQPAKKRLLDIQYKNYQEKDQHLLPNEIGIMAIATMDRTFIDITYKNIEFNRDLSFPYRIPKGFDEIVVK